MNDTSKRILSSNFFANIYFYLKILLIILYGNEIFVSGSKIYIPVLLRDVSKYVFFRVIVFYYFILR